MPLTLKPVEVTVNLDSERVPLGTSRYGYLFERLRTAGIDLGRPMWLHIDGDFATARQDPWVAK